MMKPAYLIAILLWSTTCWAQDYADISARARQWQVREGRPEQRLTGQVPTVRELEDIIRLFHFQHAPGINQGRWLTSREFEQNRRRGESVDMANYAYTQFREQTGIADDDLKVIGNRDAGDVRFVVEVKVRVGDSGSRQIFYDPLERLPSGRLTNIRPRNRIIEYSLFSIRRGAGR